MLLLFIPLPETFVYARKLFFYARETFLTRGKLFLRTGNFYLRAINLFYAQETFLRTGNFAHAQRIKLTSFLLTFSSLLLQNLICKESQSSTWPGLPTSLLNFYKYLLNIELQIFVVGHIFDIFFVGGVVGSPSPGSRLF